MLLLLLISVFKAIFLPRLLLVCVPAACLLAAVGLGRLPRRTHWIAVFILVGASLSIVRSQYRHFEAKEDWRGATAYVCSHSVPGDGVELVPRYGWFTFDYYRELRGFPAKQFPYPSDRAQDLGPSAMRRKWLIVFGAVGSNSVATQALASELQASGGLYCTVDSAQFNLIEIWLLKKCSAQS